MSGEHRSGSLLDDDAEIARILQEEELELARQQQQSAQGPRGRTGQPQAHNRNGVVPTGQTLLLQSRCSALSGQTVLNGSCYLYRNMFKFVCVERGKEVVVSLFVPSIEFIQLAFAPKANGPPHITTTSGNPPNVLQIYTKDKMIHSFFNFVDSKTFHKFFNILNSIHKNHVTSSMAPALSPFWPGTPAPIASVPTVPVTSQHAGPYTSVPFTPYLLPPPQGFPHHQTQQPQAAPVTGSHEIQPAQPPVLLPPSYYYPHISSYAQPSGALADPSTRAVLPSVPASAYPGTVAVPTQPWEQAPSRLDHHINSLTEHNR